MATFAKRILGLCMVVVLLLGLMPVQAFATEATGNADDAEILRQLARETSFPLGNISGNIAVLGDSTISGYPKYSALSTYFSVADGYTITDISKAGDTIVGQLNKWKALSVTEKSALNYVFVQIGLNDTDETAETFRAQYTSLIAQIRADAPDAMLILGTMVPCKQRWKVLYPNTWEEHQERWEIANEDIQNGYYDCDSVAYLHTEALGLDGNLRKEYNHGDHIHENAEGAKVIAYSWYLAAFGHSHRYSSIVTAPTCTEQGYTTYTCSCGESYVGDYVGAAGHQFDSIVCIVCGKMYPDTVTELDSALAVTVTPENYLTISNPFTEELACAPNLVTYGNGKFAVAYLADDVNTVETESSTTIVCRLGLFDVNAPENVTFFDIATAGQAIGNVTIGSKAPYEPNLLKLSDDALLVLFNIRDTAGNYVYYSATFDIATNTVTSYQPLTLDGKNWTPANIAASYNTLAENDISTSGPASSMVFTSRIIQYGGYYYGYCGGICSGFSGMLVRSTDGINWTSVMAPEALSEMKGVIECGFEFLEDSVYFCMRDISSGVYHCSYDFKTGEQLNKTSKLSGITTSKPTAFTQNGNLYLIVNKATVDDNTVGRRNTALFYQVNPENCRLILVRQVFCADGIAYHSVVNYNGINYWSFHTDARRINPYTQGRSNLAFLQIPELYAAESDSADGVLNLNDYSYMFGRGCITVASNTWQAGAVNMHYQIPLADFADFDTVTITANNEQKAYIAFFTKRMTQNGAIAYADGWTEQLIMEPGTVQTLTIPEDAAYLYILNNNAAGSNLLPKSVVFSTNTHTGPVITQQPESVEQEIGKKFAISVQAEGEGLTYRWYFRHANSNEWCSSLTIGNVYENTMTTDQDGCEVYCVITDVNGHSATSHTVKVSLIHAHEYHFVLTPPTCTEQGYTTYTCECGDSYVDDYVEATGEHSYENGVCIGCGASAPVTAKPMSMRYDDHVDMIGKVVEIIDAGKPTSYKVGYGVAAGTLDDAVVTLEGDTLVATGIGRALVKIDGRLYEVTVEAAPISLILLAGQSNMRGSEGNADQSIVCPDGMVYATFGDDRGDAAGIMNVNNATNFAASALTGEYSTINVNGTTDNLSYYPIYALTEQGTGTFGPDSGFAYEWVKQTGEKIWIVNAAHGGSSITSWQPGATNFKEAVLLFGACQETLQKEIAAGHYTLSHMGYFWCQGCSDYNWTAEKYVTQYLAMHEGLKSSLAFDHDSNAATDSIVFEFAGIIPVRAGHDYNDGYREGVYADTTDKRFYESFKDLQMTGPRVAQYWMCNNPDLEDIWMVCNVGEDWVWMPDGTNGVSDYFNAHYPSGTVDYTTQVVQKASWYTPTTPAAVHDSIHYNQIGYNEVGRESVRNILVILGEISAPDVTTSVHLLTWDGYTPASQISASLVGKTETLVVPKIYPLWKTKDVTFTLSDGVVWNYYDLLALEESLNGSLTVGNQTVTMTGHNWSEWETIREASADGAGLQQRTCSHCYGVEEREIKGVWQIYDLNAHLLELPDNICHDTNLWAILPHEDVHFTSGQKWGKTSTPTTSITIPVNPGDKIYATSWKKAGENGHETSNGIRVTFFNAEGIAKTMGPGQSDREFYANGGYLIAPEGTIAINIVMWYDSEDYEVYILNREHTYTATVTAPTCTEQGYTTYTCECGDSYTSDVVAALGHDFSQSFVCSRCDHVAKVSVLGDSISTYAGFSAVKNAVYPNKTIQSVEDTWWKQVVDTMGAQLLVNNASGGSRVLSDEYFNGNGIREGNYAAYRDRCVNLHDGDEKPDVIFVFMGTNDFSYHVDSSCEKCQILLNCSECTAREDGNLNVCSKCRSISGIYSSFCNLPLGIADSVNASAEVPTSVCEAYAIMLSKMKAAYPNAQIYCMGLLPRVNPYQNATYHDHGQPTAFNAELKKVAENAGARFISLEQSVDNSASTWNTYFGDAVHPTAIGMDRISAAVLTDVLGKEIYTVSSQIVSSAVTMTGESWAMDGAVYEASVITLNPDLQFDVRVIMNGVDVTENVFNAQTGRIYIVEVTGNILITVKTEGIFWSIGTINTINGADADDYKNRIRTDYISVNEGVTVRASNDAEINVVYFDANYKILSTNNNTGWIKDWTSVGAPTAAAYIRVVARATSGTNLTTEYSQNVTITCGHVHDYIPTVTAPTCTEQGYTTYTCACGDSYVADYVDALGHTEVVDAAIKENSARPGKTEGSHCATCGQILIAQQEILAKGYDWMLEDGEFKILLIGNSYSQDASNGSHTTDSQLLTILQALLGEDVKITVALLYSGGKGMHWHATQAEQGNTAYSFRVISTDNPQWTSKGSYKSADALAWTDWDVISLQPYNINVGTGEESVPYPEQTDPKFYHISVSSAYMLDHVTRYALQADIYFYMHWAQTSGTILNAALSNYNKQAAFMPQVLDYTGTESGAQFNTLIPVGLSIQNARTTYLALLRYNTTAYADGNLNLITDAQIGLQRDGGHVSFNIGRYIAALTFAEMIIPEDMRADNYVLPEIRITESVGKLPKEYTEIAKKAVLAAVSSWKQGSLSVTEIEGYLQDPTEEAERILTNAVLDLSCGISTEPIIDRILALLPADFVVDEISLPENIVYGDVFHFTVTVRFGYMSVTCELSGNVTKHEYKSVVTAPTCTEQGYTTHTCHCGDSYVDSYVNALGHSFGEWYETKAPTCTEKGTERRDCEAYDHFETREVEALGHDTNKHSAKDATCTEIGWNAYETCSRCDYTTCVEIPATGHSHKAVVTAPTCTEQGYTTHTCHCGDSYVDRYVNALGHSYGAWVVTTKPTCTTVGEERRDCDACDHFETREIKATGHSYNVVVTKPTCTEQGYTTHTCHCGESYVDSYVAALGHSYGAWVTTTKPTCTAVGEERRDCNECDHYETREVKATGHNYNAVVTKPTCTSQGYTTHTCRCGESYVDSYINALGHTYGSWVTTTKPTCTEKGTERRDCDVCDHFEMREVMALGHDVTKHSAKDATCTEIGWNAYETCSRCDYSTYAEIPATGHNYNAVVTKPTCTSQGYTTHTCHCGDSYVDSYVAALGHTFGAWVTTTKPTCTTVGEERRDCDACDHFETREIKATGHSYNVVITKPTCTEQGYTTHTCHCGDSYVDSYVNALGHSFGAWVVTAKPNCTEKGTERRDCDACDHFETREIKATGHSYDAVVTKPTCTEKGYTTHTCHCGESYIDSYVNALGHKFGAWVVTTKPTCTKKGTERRDCDACDHFETREVKVLGHNIIKHAAQGATCTEIGWNAYETCSRCDYSTYAEIPATGHSYTAVVTKPTCTEQGYTTHTCHCGDSYVDSYVNALGHSYEAAVTEPSCTEYGFTIYTCHCGDSYVSSYVSALGHSFDEWKTTTEPTCTENGEESRECSICAHVETREIKALGHSYNVVVTDPTCTEHGYTTHTCHCGDSYVDGYVKPLGHAYGDWYQTKAPTENEPGEKRRDCGHCGGFETSPIAELGHDHSRWELIMLEAVAPTCTKTGLTEGSKCSRCGEILVAQEIIHSLGHDFGEWTETKSATCTEDGTERRECDRCDHFETRTIIASGHSYNAVVTHPTCTEKGYTTHTCQCGDSYVDSYVEAIGHTFGKWREIEEATCEQAGKERRDCAACGSFEIRDIEATGHNYNAIVTEPTCTEQGHTTHTCECGDAYIDSYVKALGHKFGEWTTTTESTCIEAGEEHRTCVVCGHVETREVAATGHSYNAVVTKPTCTEQGYITYTCECGDSYVDGYVDATGHTFGAWTETQAPTCTEQGSERRACDACDHVETREVVALGHDLITHAPQSATCTEIGWSAYETCSRCDYTTYAEISAKGHEHHCSVTAPTCTEKGYTTHTCSSCGDSYVDAYVDPVGHSLGEWTQAKAPTCVEQGTERRDCDRCDLFEVRELPMTDHVDNDSDGTCDTCGQPQNTSGGCRSVLTPSFSSCSMLALVAVCLLATLKKKKE